MPNLNEATCPVAIELVALLLRSDAAKVESIVGGLSPETRANLAIFCAGRRHMRDLGLAIAARCEQRELARIAGVAGSVLFSQARLPVHAQRDPRGKPAVTLARLAS